MAGEKIQFEITAKGIKMDASGFVGRKCVTELEKIEAELKKIGIETKVINQKFKQEVHLVDGGAHTVSYR